MTLINIDLRNVAGETGRHDQVVFHAPVHREGSAGQTIQTAPVIVDLEGGIGSVDLDPGPVVVEIRARGWEDTAPKTVMVPEEGPITLTGLLLDAFEWAPVVVSEVRALAQRVENVADTFGSLEGVATSVQAAEDAAASAEADRVVVEQAATSASWSGDRLTVLGAMSPPLTGDKGDPGPPGDTPTIGENGNWWVDGVDTGVKAQGPSGSGTGDVLWSELDPVLDGKADVAHSHTASQISDATTVGRNVLTASSQAAARTAIGAGTSNLALGTTSSTAARGNHTHSQYATTAQVEARTPEILVVSTIPTPRMPGVVYLRFG